MELGDRGKALEDQFFHNLQEKQIEELRAKRAKQATKQALSEASGMTDDAILDRLVEVGIGATTVSAMCLVPLVHVAWADGQMDDRERNAILHGAAAKGIQQGSPAYELLSQWLAQKPGSEMLASWSEYIRALHKELSDEQRDTLRSEVVGRARAVAEAAGGFLGLKTISEEEKRALAQLDNAFKP